jgi:mannobiose 2-epimerase
MIKKDLEAFQKRVRSELYENIIPFWQKHTVDNEFGGFTGYVGPDLKIDKKAGKGLILNARILWTFAAMYRFDNNPEYLELAKRAYDYLNEYFRDKQFGGVFWMVDYRGQCADDSKKIYGQAFYIYALAEYYLATKDDSSLDRANEMFELIEQHSFDKVNTGYFEICNRDWTVAEGARLSDKDMNEKKSMNNHLHVIESYTNLYRCERSEHKPIVAEKILGLIDNFTRHIIDRKTFHFNHFFDDTWRPKSDSYTFGHDIEGSWLLYEAAEILEKPSLKKEVADIALKMAEVVFKEGLDKDGGLLYEGRGGKIINSDKEWWPQAEAVVGFLNAYQLSGKEHFLQAALNSWNFIDRCIVDHEKGEWFMKTTRDGKPNLADPKVSEWKCPYHNTRTCIETIHRLQAISK